MQTTHNFHIPVMGTGFTIDTPIKVAKFGISSVISIIDDMLIERMREYYSKENHSEFIPITDEVIDYRAKRITAYLNLVNQIVKKQFAKIKTMSWNEENDLKKYFDLLPDYSSLKIKYEHALLLKDESEKLNCLENLKKEMNIGSIDVNIMTKLDKINFYTDGTPMESEFSDALAALRGFANSELTSSVVFSAGLNPRLYSYIEKFPDFFPDFNGEIKKNIILKVSDFRSASIQGKFLAKKGLLISEFRIESGLNCGGHAFATDGFLLGSILEEFKNNKDSLTSELHQLYSNALQQKGISSPFNPYPIKITIQGGIGTAKEHDFLLNYYEMFATGWGSPFLLVPEVTNVDEETLCQLADAQEKDLYLSDVSPLGVKFNNLKNSPSELQKKDRISDGKPGSPCVKKYLISNADFTKEPLCTASYSFQKHKIKELKNKNLNEQEFDLAYNKIVEKSCICDGLGVAAERNIGFFNKQKTAPAICPGPNIAYFSKISSLEEMVNHIYGRINLLNNLYRPNMFIKELNLYVDYLKEEIKKNLQPLSEKQIIYFNKFKENLQSGIEYYKQLIPKMKEEADEYKEKMKEELVQIEKIILSIGLKIEPVN